MLDIESGIEVLTLAPPGRDRVSNLRFNSDGTRLFGDSNNQFLCWKATLPSQKSK